MKNKRLISVFLVLLISLTGCFNLFAQSTTPEPYNNEEFPQTLKDLRRFEIITLGAMPFVTLDVSIGYSAYKSITTGAPFNPIGASNYSQDEQFGIILTSLAISTGIGLTDLIINIVKRNVKSKKEKTDVKSYINVVPIKDDPEAIKVELEDVQEIILEDEE